jgi:hypothetical protein
MTAMKQVFPKLLVQFEVGGCIMQSDDLLTCSL